MRLIVGEFITTMLHPMVFRITEIYQPLTAMPSIGIPQ